MQCLARGLLLNARFYFPVIADNSGEIFYFTVLRLTSNAQLLNLFFSEF
jgi:hypothetical protein